MTLSRRLVLAAPALIPTLARAQGFPERPLTLVVPFTPGGTIDVLARALAPELSRELGQTVVIDTRPGAGGNVGAAFVAQQARPDAHTLLFTGSGLASSVSLNALPFDPVRDLIPVAGLGAIPSLVVVSRQSPYRNMASIIAVARARPGTVTYASAGPSTGTHLAGALLGAAAGVDLVHVPYRGAGPAYPDLIAERVDMMLDIMTSSIGQVQQGAVAALATTSSRRSEVLPDVPTVAEAAVPDYEFTTWIGMFARAGAPEASLRRLEEAVLRAAEAPAVRERLRLSAAEPMPAHADGFGRYFRQDVERWADLVRAGRLERAQ
jgi:tripartite-type tricarboxylate transporter receptor subunit TctC